MNTARTEPGPLMRLHRRLLPDNAELGWTPYLWLVYLSFFFVSWFFQLPGRAELVLGIGTIGLFLALYFSAFWRHGMVALGHIAAITLLGVIWAPFNIGAGTFFIYAASFAYRVGPPRTAAWIVAAVAVCVTLTALIGQGHPFFWLPGGLISVLIGAANIFFAEQARQNAALRLSQSEVRQLARVAERERIARDLHDLLGHTLSLIALKSELARKLIDSDAERARSEIETVEATARKALSEVREAVSGFRQQGLTGELEQARMALTAAGVELDQDVADNPQLDSQTEAVLALVLRESVTNIIRHARAHRCRIRLQPEADGEWVLTISDDGRGGIRPDGAGIDGMRARIESLGGRFSIGGREGAELTARVPAGGAA